jgi:hypothetical protein
LTLADRLVLVMAVKYAQRRSVFDLAKQLYAHPVAVELELKLLDRSYLTRRWTDRRWGLTSAGNLLRNRLT